MSTSYFHDIARQILLKTEFLYHSCTAEFCHYVQCEKTRMFVMVVKNYNDMSTVQPFWHCPVSNTYDVEHKDYKYGTGTCFWQLFSTSQIPVSSSADQKFTTVLVTIQYLLHKSERNCVPHIFKKD